MFLLVISEKERVVIYEKIIKLLVLITIISTVLIGCSGNNSSNENTNSSRDMKLYVEDTLTTHKSNDKYIFTGFVETNTLTFESVTPVAYDSMTVKIHYPAEIGYKLD